MFDKGGISYKSNLKEKFYKNYFAKSASINNLVVCNYCNQNGHMKLGCPIKINAYYGVKVEPLLTLKDPKIFG